MAKSRLVVPHPKKTFLGQFKEKVPDLKEVLTVCRFAPLSIRFNKAYPSWGWSFHGPVIHRTLQTDRRIGYPPTAYDCHKQEVKSPGPYGGAIALVSVRSQEGLTACHPRQAGARS